MAYVMRISGWSSDVCSSDLRLVEVGVADQRTGDDDFLTRCRALYGCVLRIGRSRNQGDAHHERRSAQLQLGIMGFLHSAVPCYWWIEITRTPGAASRDRKSTRLNSSH